MTSIGIILGSTRPGRRGEQVAKWVLEVARARVDADFELIDLADYPLPHLDEPMPPSMGQYQNQHTKDWAAAIAQFDGFVFVTPEYNHSTSGVLKNAIDYLYAEWNNKAMGVVSYGVVGGTRAAEHLRLIAGELQMGMCEQMWLCRWSPTFETSRTSHLVSIRAKRSTRCSVRCSLGARLSNRCAKWPSELSRILRSGP